MSEDKKMKNDKVPEAGEKETLALDDARRVKVLSPTMLVMKRFIRNKLAIVGLVILVAMFSFSFLGSVVSPYGQVQVFKQVGVIPKDYAMAKINTELLFTIVEGSELPSAARSQIILAVTTGESTCTADGTTYTITNLGEDLYSISASEKFASVLAVGDRITFSPEAGKDVTDGMKDAFTAAYKAGEESFDYNGENFYIGGSGKRLEFGKGEDIALASKLIFDANSSADSSIVSTYGFRNACGVAFTNGQSSFMYNGVSYTLETEDENGIVYNDAGAPFAGISNVKVETAANDVELSFGFKEAAREAVAEIKKEFTHTGENGTETVYKINLVNSNYYILTDTETELISRYEEPSWGHWLGTDGNGMDVLTRLMYGGRISLMVGFVVIFIELLLGVVIGGIAGYFGGIIDTLLMRVVDLFNSIPFWPMAIIAGSVMDSLKFASMMRIFALMAILGVLGWTGIARIVRGQILTLREQDFMVATEATGIRVRRRIFRHLVPNVMPLLIVQATMGLGSIIITEATLSFLGLGVKYPLASWGSIINAANDIQIMTNFWFIWMPAGLMIVLAVLGFNFVGDGLRDAFDPKMKR